MAACPFDERSVTALVHRCPWFAHRRDPARTKGPIRPVADAPALRSSATRDRIGWRGTARRAIPARPGSSIERQSGPVQRRQDLVGDHPASGIQQLSPYPLLQDPYLKAACPPILRPVHQLVAGCLSEIVGVHTQQPAGQPIDPDGGRGGWEPVIDPVVDPQQRCPQPRHRTGRDDVGMAKHHGRPGQDRRAYNLGAERPHPGELASISDLPGGGDEEADPSVAHRFPARRTSGTSPDRRHRCCRGRRCQCRHGRPGRRWPAWRVAGWMGATSHCQARHQ
jgi:hypothetical protein